MDSTIIVAVIGGLCTAVPTLIGVMLQNRSTKAMVEYRLEKLEEKVGVHNGLEGKIMDLRAEVKVLHEKEAVSNHRLTDLEKRVA